MGIKSINVLLKEHAPNAFTKARLMDFYGHRICIDTPNFIYTKYSGCQKDVIGAMPNPLDPIDVDAIYHRCLNELIAFIRQLFEFGITPILCWDGQVLPDKFECRNVRKAHKERTIERIQAYRVLLEAKHPLERTSGELNEFKKLLCQHRVMHGNTFKRYQEVVQLLGVPSLIAEFEAEKLCANLVLDGLATAVWSTDTDLYPLGCPLMISGYASNFHDPMVNVVQLHSILDGLEMDLTTFVDLCIVLGCDFNMNLPGIGPKRGLKLIRECGNIDQINHPSIAVLRHHRCRELFGREPTKCSRRHVQFNHKIFRQLDARKLQLIPQYPTLVAAAERIIVRPKVVVVNNQPSKEDEEVEEVQVLGE